MHALLLILFSDTSCAMLRFAAQGKRCIKILNKWLDFIYFRQIVLALAVIDDSSGIWYQVSGVSNLT